MNANGNDTRQRVFVALVRDGGSMTPSEVGEAIDARRQNVQYHLRTLSEMGLIVSDDDGYRAQPVFTDDEFQAEFVGLISDLVPKVEAHLEGEPPAVATDGGTVVNTVSAMLNLSEMGPQGDYTWGRPPDRMDRTAEWQDSRCKRCGDPLPNTLLADAHPISDFCSSSCWKEYNRGWGEYPFGWERVRELILSRDGWRCWTCHLSESAAQLVYGCSLPVHHVNKVKEDCRPGNLITLCPACHARLEDVIAD